MPSVIANDSTIAIARHAPARRRRTKIVATLGPATDDEDTLVSLFETGVDVARVNFSHGSAEQQAERIERVRRVANRVGRYVGIMGDLQGPKIRIESFAAGQTVLQKDAEFTLDTAMDPAAGTDSAVGVAYRNLVNDVIAGDTLLLNDGQIVLSVLEIVATEVRCKVVRGGVLSNRKGLNKGRATLSRHQYGDAADVWVDNDGDWYMDDLNGDGRRDTRDARVILSAMEAVERTHPELAGGGGIYGDNGAHGPFIHIDVRGKRARW